MKINKYPKTTLMISRLAKKADLIFNLEPQSKHVGQLIMPNNKKLYVKNTSMDINNFAASEIARDKDYTNYFLKKMKYPVAKSKAFFSDSWCKVNNTKNNYRQALKFARAIGFPLIIKPNSKGQGEGIFKVYDEMHFKKVTKRLFKKNNIILVQEFIEGEDFRFVIFNNTCEIVYKRLPLSITGDGKKNIKSLLNAKINKLRKENREIKVSVEDERIKERLRNFYKINMKFVPAQNQKIVLLDNANLSTGGEVQDVTDTIDEKYKKLAINAAFDMGLNFVGVDIMVGKKAIILELNSSLGLTHFMESGKIAKQKVENLYVKIIEYLKVRTN